MEPNSLKWVGSSCGLHGHYVFYKAFKFASRDAEARILSLGDFFLVRCKPDEPICVAELQLLWEERTSRQLLSSSKLYFLPEDTPQGRDVSHGEHEVIAVSEKVIVRLQDLVKWAVPDFSEWSRGLKAEPLKASVLRELGTNGRREALHRYRESTLTSGLNFKDVQRERARLGQEEDGRKVLVLSYPQYCRYRSVLVRLRERPTSMLLNHTVLALGGIAALGANTRILYCRDTFEHPTLLQNDSICDQFAPNLKGRPRKKKLSISQRRDSGTAHYLNSPETKNHKVKTSCRALANGKLGPSAKHKTGAGLGRKPEKERAVESAEERSEQEENAYPSPLEEEQKEEEEEPEEQEATVEEVAEEEEEEEEEEESREDEQAFLVELYKYMKKRDTPIERIPFLGFKQINLWTMFQAAQKLGGYELITVRRQWKHVYDELGGNPSSTSAATCTRRHYERLLLPYERHLKGEQDKPLPLSKPRNHEKAPPAKVKGVAGVKKVKVPSGVKTVRKDRGEMAATQRQSQDSKAEVSAKPEVPAVDEPIVIEEEEEEEEELQVTLKEEESLAGELPAVAPLCFKEAESVRAPLAPLAPRPLHPGAQPEWRKISEVLQAAKTEVHPVARSTYPPHLRDQNKPPGRDEPSESHGGGRAARVPSACKQDRRSVESGGDSFPEKDDYAAIQRDAPSQMAAAYCKTGQGVMSPLAKKKLLSQACESTSFCFASSFRPPPASERDGEKWRGEEEPPRRHVHDGVPEAAPVFRPSVIQHAQSSKPPRDPAPAPSPVGAPWQPFLPRTRERDGAADKISEKLLRSRGFAAGDCYSSPHLHSLYRQTEHCLNRDQMGGYANGERAEPFSRDRDGEQGFVCCGLEKEGLAYRSHYSDEARTGDADDGPRDFSLSKALSQRLSKASFCALPYPMAHVPKGCRASPPMREPSPPYPSPKPLLESSLVRPAKRLVGDPEGEEAPERKLRPCQAEETSHAVAHLDKGHSAYALARAAPLYANMYPPGGLVSQDGLQRHPGLQYLKSQSAVSPLVPPLAFHSMMLHRQLLASAPGPHHLFRHPGGAAFCGDLLHQLYPLSTLPPPQLSSVHPSTRL